MKYRCPYCKAEIGEALGTHCPRCGKFMRVPEQNLTERRRASRRAIERIAREYEQKKAELHTVPAGLLRNPRFYFGAVAVFVVLGGALFNATDHAVRSIAITPEMRAARNVDVLAEALGRYRFHVGAYPDAAQGLAALVRDPQVPKWNGPYINQLRKDPWGTPYVYEPVSNARPVILSCGPDKLRGTPDDLKPDPARFDPGTGWTNGWVSETQRLPGVTVLKSLPAAGSEP
jgi:type II secretion system protein G